VKHGRQHGLPPPRVAAPMPAFLRSPAPDQLAEEVRSCVQRAVATPRLGVPNAVGLARQDRVEIRTLRRDGSTNLRCQPPVRSKLDALHLDPRSCVDTGRPWRCAGGRCCGLTGIPESSRTPRGEARETGGARTTPTTPRRRPPPCPQQPVQNRRRWSLRAWHAPAGRLPLERRGPPDP
jgi:hypothetical protein